MRIDERDRRWHEEHCQEKLKYGNKYVISICDDTKPAKPKVKDTVENDVGFSGYSSNSSVKKTSVATTGLGMRAGFIVGGQIGAVLGRAVGSIMSSIFDKK